MVIVYFVMWWEKRCLLGVAVEGERSRADQQQLRCRVTSERPSSPNDVVALERIAHRVCQGQVPQEQHRGEGSDGADRGPVWGRRIGSVWFSLKDDSCSTGAIDWRIGALS